MFHITFFGHKYSHADYELKFIHIRKLIYFHLTLEQLQEIIF